MNQESPLTQSPIENHQSKIPRGRLAPSPTGYLHVGNARSFLLAWLQMRSIGGEIFLRIEDLDMARAVPGAAHGIVEDLQWLGLDWDNRLTLEYFQSNRFQEYQAAIQELQKRGLVYECFCSRKELREIANAPHGATARYSGRCRDLTTEQREMLRDEKSPALRFRVAPGTIVSVVDGLHGPQAEDVYEVTGDFIIARADGVPSYQLAVVLDDIAMGITHVLRGSDLLPSTPRQILLFNTFGAATPSYTHVPLMLGPDGARLAKRHGSVSIAELRAAGHAPETVTGWLAWSCGLIPKSMPVTARELLEIFSIELVGTADTEVGGVSS